MSAHAKLSPSAASRWMACAGSVALSAGLPDGSSEFADEGTFAHSIAARCLTTGRRAETCFGMMSDAELGLRPGSRRFRVDDDMVTAVQCYLDAISQQILIDGERARFIEQRVRITTDVHGTPDYVSLSDDGKTLHVWDFKYGAGVFVEVEDNEQLMTYGLGALLTHAAMCRGVETVVLHIVQPRFFGDCAPWRSWSVSAKELRTTFADELLAAAAATQEKDAPLASGPHCRFCRAKAICPELKRNSLAAAQHAFAKKIAPEPQTLEPAEVARLLPLFDRAEEWISAVRAHAYELANQGKAIPGYKLVAKISNRKWTDEGVATATLRQHGIDMFKPRELISPAEAERRAGSKAKAAFVDALTTRPVTGSALVPEDDKRPAIAAAAAVFSKVDNQTE